MSIEKPAAFNPVGVTGSGESPTCARDPSFPDAGRARLLFELQLLRALQAGKVVLILRADSMIETCAIHRGIYTSADVILIEYDAPAGRTYGFLKSE